MEAKGVKNNNNKKDLRQQKKVIPVFWVFHCAHHGCCVPTLDLNTYPLAQEFHGSRISSHLHHLTSDVRQKRPRACAPASHCLETYWLNNEPVLKSFVLTLLPGFCRICCSELIIITCTYFISNVLVKIKILQHQWVLYFCRIMIISVL